MGKKPFIDFESFDGEKFRYRQSDGAILKISNEVFISEKEHITSFAIDEERVKNNLENSLELLIINATSNCNLRCGYCVFSEHYEGESRFKESIMPITVAKMAIDYLFNHSIKIQERTLSFYGGEPLLDGAKDLVKFSTQYAKTKATEKNMPTSICITTNGTTLTDWIDWLVENNIMLFLSLDGPQYIQDKWRGKGTFKKIMDGIEKIIKKDEDYFKRKVSFSSTFVDISKLPKIRDFFNSNFPNQNIRLSGIRHTGIHKDSLLRKIINENLSKSMYEEYAKEYTNIISEGDIPNKFLKALFDQMIMIIYYRQRGLLNKPMWPTNTCVPGGKKLFVKEDGKFHACEKAYGIDFEVGDVYTGVNYEKVNVLMKKYVDTCNEECKKCWAPRICGSCFMSIRKGEKIDTAVMEEACPSKLKSLEIGLKIYTSTIARNKKSIENYLKSLKPLFE